MNINVIPFQKSILFDSPIVKRLHLLLFGDHTPLSWNGTKVSHRRFHNNRRMNISSEVS
jgi:hypothetical protein